MSEFKLSLLTALLCLSKHLVVFKMSYLFFRLWDVNSLGSSSVVRFHQTFLVSGRSFTAQHLKKMKHEDDDEGHFIKGTMGGYDEGLLTEGRYE